MKKSHLSPTVPHFRFYFSRSRVIPRLHYIKGGAPQGGLCVCMCDSEPNLSWLTLHWSPSWTPWRGERRLSTISCEDAPSSSHTQAVRQSGSELGSQAGRKGVRQLGNQAVWQSGRDLGSQTARQFGSQEGSQSVRQPGSQAVRK